MTPLSPTAAREARAAAAARVAAMAAGYATLQAGGVSAPLPANLIAMGFDPAHVRLHWHAIEAAAPSFLKRLGRA